MEHKSIDKDILNWLLTIDAKIENKFNNLHDEIHQLHDIIAEITKTISKQSADIELIQIDLQRHIEGVIQNRKRIEYLEKIFSEYEYKKTFFNNILTHINHIFNILSKIGIILTILGSIGFAIYKILLIFFK